MWLVIFWWWNVRVRPRSDLVSVPGHQFWAALRTVSNFALSSCELIWNKRKLGGVCWSRGLMSLITDLLGADYSPNPAAWLHHKRWWISVGCTMGDAFYEGLSGCGKGRWKHSIYIRGPWAWARYEHNDEHESWNILLTGCGRGVFGLLVLPSRFKQNLIRAPVGNESRLPYRH